MQARRKTATPQELLYASSMDASLPSLPQTEEASTDPPRALPAMEDVMAMSHPDGACFDLGPDGNLTRVSSAPGSLKESVDATPPSSPPAGRRARENVFSRLTSTGTTPLAKPDRGVISVFTGKPILNKSSPLVCTHVAEGHSKAVLSLAVTDDVLFSSSKAASLELSASSIVFSNFFWGVISVFTGKPILNKSSPLVCTHVAEGHSKAVLSLAVTDDVLFSSSKAASLELSASSIVFSNFFWGVISVFTGKPILNKSSPLVCTHVAEGHSKAVLSLAVTDDVLFSSSKDRTVKIWNLHTGQEIQSLRGHPDNVVAVRYCEYTRLTFSVSTAYIKVWDVRENPAKCVHTLFSSGNCENGPVVADSASRSLQIPQNETRINAIELNQYGTLLFSAASNIVRIWDLRRFACVGKLAGGHQAAVMCMAVDDPGVDSSLVVTGSKDHYIKARPLFLMRHRAQ
ncbi:hypothetical protein HPB47_028511 [Ixodes persulcatus]|uniref:Uncharacterized protein n=1 Tax=Ixodes persulcatus TaxID=34615 RepID=A0AC60PSZ6_IXOPE|nr:hypothetical protein HPB47_028511 [Ixodes persulcatus]